MSIQYIASVTGLTSLAIGILLVNVISTPRASSLGAAVAGLGVAFLVLAALGRVFA